MKLKWFLVLLPLGFVTVAWAVVHFYTEYFDLYFSPSADDGFKSRFDHGAAWVDKEMDYYSIVSILDGKFTNLSTPLRVRD